MPHPFALVCRGFALSLVLAGAAAAAPVGVSAAHKASAELPARAQGCMDNTRLVSHVAYLPVDPTATMRCGHLLSTDTMLTVHHWDRT